MTFVRIASPALAAALAVMSCARQQPPGAGGGSEAAKHEPAAAPPAYSYPAPVAGHFKDVNTGEFDLVDGVAYAARDVSKGTVVYVTAKPIASPILAAGACPATRARALTLLRDAGFVEVTLDAQGGSDYYAEGTPFGARGRGIKVGPRTDWRGHVTTSAGHIAGDVDHRYRGKFRFDLPIAARSRDEVSENDRSVAGYVAWGGDAATPTEVEALTAYGLLWRAAKDGDFDRFLEIQGFQPSERLAIRGLSAIQTDFAALRARFLEPGAPESPTLAAGVAVVGARGTDPSGKNFANYYEFTSCEGNLILTSIALNPQ
jgi:hypothetical protein